MQSAREVSVLVSVSHSRMVISDRDQFIEQIRDYKKHLREIEIYSHLENTLVRSTQTLRTWGICTRRAGKLYSARSLLC